MLLKYITDHYSVSEQISLEDVDTLAASGVNLIICNRPDGEEEGQLTFAEIATYAAEKNITAVHIPFAGGQMTQENVDTFKQVMQKAQRVHGYCRTGNRASQIWQAAQAN